MIQITAEKRYGTATVRYRVVAGSIQRAVEFAGEGARVVFPIDPESFFIPDGAEEGAVEQSVNREASVRAAA